MSFHRAKCTYLFHACCCWAILQRILCRQPTCKILVLSSCCWSSSRSSKYRQARNACRTHSFYPGQNDHRTLNRQPSFQHLSHDTDHLSNCQRISFCHRLTRTHRNHWPDRSSIHPHMCLRLGTRVILCHLLGYRTTLLHTWCYLAIARHHMRIFCPSCQYSLWKRYLLQLQYSLHMSDQIAQSSFSALQFALKNGCHISFSLRDCHSTIGVGSTEMNWTRQAFQLHSSHFSFGSADSRCRIQLVSSSPKAISCSSQVHSVWILC